MSKDFLLQYEPQIQQEDIASVNEYMASGGFITEFKKTKEFENLIADYCGCTDSIIFPNGTLTLYSILKALNIGEDDKVIVPNYTMAATPFSVLETGAEVIFSDVEWPSLCLNLDGVKEAIEIYGSSISALMFVSANGRNPSYKIEDLSELCIKNNILMIEDSAQALGSYFENGQHIGSIGVAGSISFSMPKIITTGQGGAVISSNKELVNNLRTYKDFGRSSGAGTDFHDSVGLNMKFTDLQAVLGISQLNRIENIKSKKKENFRFLEDNLDSQYIKLIPNNLEFTTPWFYEISTTYRDELRIYLKSKGIGSRNMYPELNKQKAFKNHFQANNNFPFSSRISETGLWLPSHPKLNLYDMNRIIDALNSFIPSNFQ